MYLKLRPLFICQSGLLDIFYDISIKKDLIKRSCFFISDLYHYKNFFLKKNPNFENNNSILKEWEIQQKSKKILDKDLYIKLKNIHAKYNKVGNPNYVKFSDRRLLLGKHQKYSVDYKKRYKDDYLDQYILNLFCELEKFINENKSNCIINYLCNISRLCCKYNS